MMMLSNLEATKFQFLNGAIRIIPSVLRVADCEEFQFLNGAIRIRSR